MEAVDNFEHFKGFIPEVTDNKDKFYMVQLIIRKGTNLNHNNSNRSRTIRTYQIRDMVHLREYKKEMIYLCNLTGARAYINLNARLFTKTALIAIKLLTDSVLNGHEYNARAAYSKAIMDCPISGKKVWMIDLDLKDFESEDQMKIAAVKMMLEIDDTINVSLRSNYKLLNRSKNGLHILTTTFRRDVFLQKANQLAVKFELKTDASTNLYIPADNTVLPNSD
jgi:hypothetical protein